VCRAPPGGVRPPGLALTGRLCASAILYGFQGRFRNWSVAVGLTPFARRHAERGPKHTRETGGIGEPPSAGNHGDGITYAREPGTENLGSRLLMSLSLPHDYHL
jgi:hypothetical protein